MSSQQIQETPVSQPREPRKPVRLELDDDARRRILEELEYEVLLTEDFIKKFKQIPGE